MEATSQKCPHCGVRGPDSLISREDAITWPDRHIDFTLALPVAKASWAVRVVPNEKPAGPTVDWNQLVETKRKARQTPIHQNLFADSNVPEEPIPWFGD